MTNESDRVQYVPIHPESARTEPARRVPFDLSALTVTGLVIVCELDHRPTANEGPSMSMKMTQYLRLSDDSMIRLDMDRGVTAARFGAVEPVSWKRSSEEVIAEVLDLIQGDEPDPGFFPWEEYAQAARLRGMSVDADSLRGLPHTVLISDELAGIFEF